MKEVFFVRLKLENKTQNLTSKYIRSVILGNNNGIYRIEFYGGITLVIGAFLIRFKIHIFSRL